MVQSGATDLYSSRDFIAECAPPTMVASEGGYYLTQLYAALQILVCNSCGGHSHPPHRKDAQRSELGVC